MAKGLALTIGLNSVDPVHYQGWSGELNACEADARDMSDIAKSRKFGLTTLLTKKATRSAVRQELAAAAASLRAGDVFMVSYSGHGGQLPDLNNDEDDRMDETWCLYDGELTDDELYASFRDLPEGVRVLVFSDSCHSGTVTKAAYYAAEAAGRTAARAASPFESLWPDPQGRASSLQFRAMPPAIALRTYEANREIYDPILKNKDLREARSKVKASVLLISGCQDNQLSADGVFNGLFTAMLKRVWNGGKFSGGYQRFHRTILNQMPPDQSPNYFWVGLPNPQFEAQKPFTV